VPRPLKVLVATVAVAAGGMAAGRALGYRLGLHTVVRCRRGHLFETVWIPAVKLKALDLGVARIQRCPMGHHVSLVVPVKERSLSSADRAEASRHRDLRVP